MEKYLEDMENVRNLMMKLEFNFNILKYLTWEKRILGIKIYESRWLGKFGKKIYHRQEQVKEYDEEIRTQKGCE